MQNVVLNDGESASIRSDWNIVSIVEKYCGHSLAVVLADRLIELESFDLYSRRQVGGNG